MSFGSSKVRLTLAYLAVIMAVSICFSVVLYKVAVGEANLGLQRQGAALRDNLYFVRPNQLNKTRNLELNNYRERLLGRLILANTGMLVLGAGVSYYLAKRHLDPLEEALDAQARFTSDAAHELRTPLTAMKTEIEVGLRDKQLSLTESRRLLGSNLEEVAKLETLTNALLRLAKNGGVPDESLWRVSSVRELVDAAIVRVESQAKAAHITLVTSGVGPEKIRGDHDQLVELLVILLDNAIKYGRPETSVKVASRLEGHLVRISVADKGIGIKATELPHIFERFYRADQSRSQLTVAGYGLGLSLAKQITDAHRAFIAASSEPGTGSIFTVDFPSAGPKPAKKSTPKPTAKPGAKTSANTTRVSAKSQK